MHIFLTTFFLINILNSFNSVTLNTTINPNTSIKINLGSGLTFNVIKKI